MSPWLLATHTSNLMQKTATGLGGWRGQQLTGRGAAAGLLWGQALHLADQYDVFSAIVGEATAGGSEAEGRLDGWRAGTALAVVVAAAVEVGVLAALL